MWLFIAICTILSVWWLFKRFYLETLFITDLPLKAVFVTGCDSGFGFLLVDKLVRSGIPCYAGCLTEAGETELRKAVGGYAVTKGGQSLLVTIRLNVTQADSLQRAANFVTEQLGHKKLWAVVCNAGISGLEAPDDWLNIEDYQKTADVNLWGVVRTCHAFKPLIKKSRGRIVIMTSVLGLVAGPTMGPYSVSKYGAEAYCDVLRREMRPFGVGVHILEPGFYRTGLTSPALLGEVNKDRWESLPQSLKEEYTHDYLERRCLYFHRFLNVIGSSKTWRVVDAYFHAITAQYPRNRYLVGWDARLLFAPASILPDFVQDWISHMQSLLMREPTPATAK